MEQLLNNIEEQFQKYLMQSELDKIKTTFPFILCYFFNEQKPRWLWENRFIAEVLWRIHKYLCPDVAWFSWHHLFERILSWL